MNTKLVHKEKGLVVYLDKPIGEGQNAQIFKGAINFRQPNQVEVAVKLIQRNIQQREYWKKLRREFQIHQQVSHPNIIQCLDFQATKNHFHIFLELCEAPTLEDKISKNIINCVATRKLTLTQCNNIIFPLIDAFFYLSKIIIDGKQKGICHRDLKPSNILVKNEVPILIDFGMARNFETNNEVTQYQGTPYYMSPQNLKRQNYDPEKNDIWSMGIMWYQLLHGNYPWQKTVYSLDQLIEQAENLQPVFSSEIPKEFQELISSMLRIEEEHRPTWTDVVNHNALKGYFQEKLQQVGRFYFYYSIYQEFLFKQSMEQYEKLKQKFESGQIQNKEILQDVLQIQTLISQKCKNVILKNTELEKLYEKLREEQILNMDFSNHFSLNYQLRLKEQIKLLIQNQTINEDNEQEEIIRLLMFWLLERELIEIPFDEIIQILYFH